MTAEQRTILWRAALGLAVPVAIAFGLMFAAPAALYPWLKALHVIAVLSWIGGMLGLGYLFVWHAAAAPGSAESRMLTTMERQVMRAVVNPAIVTAWGVGLWLAWEGRWLTSGWLQAKLVLATILAGLHGWAARAIRRLATDEPRRSAGMDAVVNMAGGMLAAAAVALAVVKPM